MCAFPGLFIVLHKFAAEAGLLQKVRRRTLCDVLLRKLRRWHAGNCASLQQVEEDKVATYKMDSAVPPSCVTSSITNAAHAGRATPSRAGISSWVTSPERAATTVKAVVSSGVELTPMVAM